MQDGLDAMLSIIQMPPGIPVATVGVNAAQNAAILAFASFGYAEVEWVVHAFLLHFFYQEAHRTEMPSIFQVVKTY